MATIAVRPDIVIERTDQCLPRVADSAADEDDLRGEDVDKIDNTCPNIGNILFHHSLSGFIPLRRTDKRSTAIGGTYIGKNDARLRKIDAQRTADASAAAADQ